MTQPSAEAVLKNLPQEARKALVGALDQGDGWGYRCFAAISDKQAILSHEGRYITWGDLAQKGFLTPLGAEVARLARDGAGRKVERDL